MLYSIALFVHIVGAIGYFFVFGVEYVCVVGLRRARTVQALSLWASASKTVARLVPVNALCILGAGIYMVVTTWGWQTGWAFVGLGAFFVEGFAAGSVQAPRVAALATAVSDLPLDAALPAEVVERAKDHVLWQVTHATIAVAFGIVFLMVIKPGVLGALAALVVALLIGLAVGVVTEARLAGGRPRVAPTR